MEERRKKERINISLPVKMHIDSINQNAISTNISEDGIQLISQENVALNSSFNISINCENDLIFAEYTVLNSQKNTSNTFLLSGKFKKIKNPDKIFLVKKSISNKLEHFRVRKEKNKCQ